MMDTTSPILVRVMLVFLTLETPPHLLSPWPSTAARKVLPSWGLQHTFQLCFGVCMSQGPAWLCDLCVCCFLNSIEHLCVHCSPCGLSSGLVRLGTPLGLSQLTGQALLCRALTPMLMACLCIPLGVLIHTHCCCLCRQTFLLAWIRMFHVV